ncbi:MAG: hypothetical protein AAF460_09000 [Pseudomonadota bacterium]
MSTAQSLDDKARTILQHNDKGSYTVPTHGLYPYQWNWDSAFAAMGFAQFDIDRAWVELETLFSGQWDDGMVPHILFHQIDENYFPGPDVWQGRGPIPSSGISQPPVAATLARRVYDRNPDVGAVRLAPLFDNLLAWHRWFMDWRLDQGAVCITHPWEAGRDNAPDWDVGMAAIDPVDVGSYTRRDISHVDSDMRPTKFDYDRYIWLVQRGARLNWQQADLLEDSPFRVADPTMTFTLLRANRDLAVLASELGRDTAEIHDWIGVLESGVETLWNPAHRHYDGRDVLTGMWANSLSNASFLCWYAGIDSADMREHLGHVLAEVSYGIPSLDLRDERFDGQRYWRGPVWGMMNMMAGLGMNEMGMPEGEALRESTAKLIAEHGFAEYFDPRDGTPAGGQSFTWTAAVWLGWASPTAEAV